MTNPNPKGKIKQPKKNPVPSPDDKTGNESQHLVNGWDREIKYLATKEDVEKCRTEIQKLRTEIAEVKVWWLGKALGATVIGITVGIAVLRYFFA